MKSLLENKKALKEDLSISRSIFIMLFIFVLLGLVLGRAIYIQTINSKFLQEKGSERHTKSLVLPAFRGKIIDRNGSILAITNMTKDISVNPMEFSKDQKNIKSLLKILNMNNKDFEDKISGSKTFVYLKRQVDLEDYEKIKELKIKGLNFENSQKRYYPTSEVSSHVVGVIDVENKGQEGVELSKDSTLKGISGERVVLRDRKGDVVGEIGTTKNPENGNDVQLTIDAKVQAISRKYLIDAIKKHNASAGSVVVLDAESGDILSLVNYPDYEPNTRSGLNWKSLRNRALVDIFEPGSILKPFSISLAMDKKLVNEGTVFDTSEVKIGNKSITDTHPKESQSVAEIVQRSSNIGTVKIAMMLKPEEMWKLFDKVGYGKKLDVGFPGESKGILRTWSKWKPIEQANISFGQGISVNLLQIAHSYQVFANNGTICEVRLFKEELDKKNCERVISAKNAAKMKEMLYAVTEKEGTAPLAQTKLYTTAGKTGTANKVEDGKYVNKYIASFVGFAPVKNPKIIVAVMVDEPKKISHFGGIVAAPVFSSIVSEILPYYEVESDKEAELININGEKSSVVLNNKEKQNEKEGSFKLNKEIISINKDSDSYKENSLHVQIGAYKTKELAEGILSKFKKDGYNGNVSLVEIGKEKFFRVRIGPFDSLGAEIFSIKAKELNYPTKTVKN